MLKENVKYIGREEIGNEKTNLRIGNKEKYVNGEYYSLSAHIFMHHC